VVSVKITILPAYRYVGYMTRDLETAAEAAEDLLGLRMLPDDLAARLSSFRDDCERRYKTARGQRRVHRRISCQSGSPPERGCPPHAARQDRSCSRMDGSLISWSRASNRALETISAVFGSSSANGRNRRPRAGGFGSALDSERLAVPAAQVRPALRVRPPPGKCRSETWVQRAGDQLAILDGHLVEGEGRG
jgi:hypothetical protein